VQSTSFPGGGHSTLRSTRLIAGIVRVGLVCVATVALAGGCSGPEHRTATVPEKESLWRDAEKARLAGEHAAAAERYATFFRFHHEDERAPAALLEAGAEYRRAGLPQRAREHLMVAAERKDPRIAPLACLQLGYLDRSEGRHAAAAMRFADAAALAQESETRAEALLEAGLSLQKAGAFSEAARPLGACVELSEVAPRHAAEARLALAQEPFFTVQTGAFVERARAAEQVARLEKAGFPAEVKQVAGGDAPLHRVTSGRFPRRPEAEEHAARLSRALGSEVMIRP
jgi:tetratricopeptide (TPR) repeat protein